MSKVWGTYLRDFRERTGLTQGEFSDAMSLLWLQLSDAEKEGLNEIGVDHLDLGSSDLSRYENGRRLPRNRSRYILLIFALYKLDGIQTIDEADEWLNKADQGPLTLPEKSAIFDSLVIDRSEAIQTGHAEEKALSIPPTERLAEQANPSQPHAGTWQKPTEAQLTTDQASSTAVSDQLGRNAEQSATGDSSGNMQGNNERPSGNAIKAIAWALVAAAAIFMLVIGTRMILNTPASPAIPIDPDNLISNGTFSNGMEGWVGVTADSTVGKLELYVEDEALCANIIESGPDLIFAKIIYYGLEKLPAQTEYVLSFNADVDSARAVGIEIPRSAYIGRELTSGPQSIEATFFQDSVDNDASIVFRIGRDGPGVICFDNIVLKSKATVALPAKPVVTPDPNNLIVNGGFDLGTTNWWYWVSPGNELSINTKNGELCGEVLSSPEQPYEIQFGHHILVNANKSSSQNANYLLSFDVTEATTGGRIDFGLGTHIKLFKSVDLQRGPQKIEEIALELIEVQHPSLSFHLGQQEEGSIVCIDNIVLIPDQSPVVESTVDSTEPNIAASTTLTATDSVTEISANVSASDNLVANGEFAEDLAGWWLWAGNGGEAELSVKEGELCAEIQASGEHPASVNVGLNNVALSQLVTHTVLFDVTSDIDRTMRIVIDETNEERSLRAGQQQIALEFTPTEINPAGQLAFWLGAQAAGTVCFDNVVIVPKG